MHYLKMILLDRPTDWTRPIRFGLVGLSGMLPDLLCFTALLFVLPLPLARGGAIWAAMTWNFFLNRKLTFSDAQVEPMGRQYVLFCGSCLAGALVSWACSTGLCLSGAFFAQHPLIAAVF